MSAPTAAIAKWTFLLERSMETPLSTSQFAVLAALLMLEQDGRARATKAQIGDLVGLKERQVANVLRELESVLSLIQKRRNGGSGKGRAANSYELRPDATGNPVPATWRRQTIADSGNRQSSAGNAVPSASPDQHSSAGNPVLVAVAIDTDFPPKDNNQTPLEIYPEPLESSFNNNNRASESPPKVLNGSARGMNAQQLAAVVVKHINSPWLDPNRSHGLATSAGTLAALVSAGADFDLDILPTIKRLMAGKREHVRSFGYFETAIRDAAARRMAAEATRNPITAFEALNDQSSGAPQRSDYTRRKRDPVFDAIHGIETRR